MVLAVMLSFNNYGNQYLQIHETLEELNHRSTLLGLSGISRVADIRKLILSLRILIKLVVESVLQLTNKWLIPIVNKNLHKFVSVFHTVQLILFSSLYIANSYQGLKLLAICIMGIGNKTPLGTKRKRLLN